MKRYSGLFITGEGNELTHYIGGADNDKPADSDADHTTGCRDEIVTGVRLLRGNTGRDNTTIDVSHVPERALPVRLTRFNTVKTILCFSH